MCLEKKSIHVHRWTWTWSNGEMPLICSSKHFRRNSWEESANANIVLLDGASGEEPDGAVITGSRQPWAAATNHATVSDGRTTVRRSARLWRSWGEDYDGLDLHILPGRCYHALHAGLLHHHRPRRIERRKGVGMQTRRRCDGQRERGRKGGWLKEGEGGGEWGEKEADGLDKVEMGEEKEVECTSGRFG